MPPNSGSGISDAQSWCHKTLIAPEQLTAIVLALQKYQTRAMKPSLPANLLPLSTSPAFVSFSDSPTNTSATIKLS